jgi:hypothetical protein
MAKTKRKSKKLNKTRRRRGGGKQNNQMPSPPRRYNQFSPSHLPSPPSPPPSPIPYNYTQYLNSHVNANKKLNLDELDEFTEYYMTNINAITELKNIISTFYTTNSHKNILCTIILLMSIISYNNAYSSEQTGENEDNHKKMRILVKGGLAVQIALSKLKTDSYVTNDADFAIFDKKLALSIAKLICNCINKQLPSNLKLIFKDEYRGDSSSVIKISLKPKNRPYLPMADISYIASDIDEQIYEETKCENHKLTDTNGSFCSPSINNLIMDKLYYIDFYTSKRPYESKVTKKAYDDKFKKSLHRSINSLLDVLTIPLSKSAMSLEPKDRKINLVIDEYVNKFNVADLDNSLADRLRGFITHTKTPAHL